MMTEVTVQLPDEILERLRKESLRLNKPMESIINNAILYFLENDDPDEETILRGIRRGMQQALAGDYRPAHEVLDEIDNDMSDNDDIG